MDAEIVESCLGTTVSALRDLPAPRSTTYALRRWEVDLADGRRLDVFHKSYDVSPLASDVALSRGRRERYVYEHVLRGLELGTPVLYGVVWDDSADRHELLLEFVEARKLRRSDFADRVAAARWLGRLHAGVAQHVAGLAQSGQLLSYDPDYFRGTADRALAAVLDRFPSLMQQLSRALRGYAELMDRLCAVEPTLVHGSFRNRNVLVSTSAGVDRICPVDWEWAGTGPPLHDLAFVVDGCEPSWAEPLCEAYVAARQEAVVGLREMVEAIEGFRLHKALRSLARSAEWTYPEDVVVKIVAKAETIAHSLR